MNIPEEAMKEIRRVIYRAYPKLQAILGDITSFNIMVPSGDLSEWYRDNLIGVTLSRPGDTVNCGVYGYYVPPNKSYKIGKRMRQCVQGIWKRYNLPHNTIASPQIIIKISPPSFHEIANSYATTIERRSSSNENKSSNLP